MLDISQTRQHATLCFSPLRQATHYEEKDGFFVKEGPVVSPAPTAQPQAGVQAGGGGGGATATEEEKAMMGKNFIMTFKKVDCAR